jgi:hydroxymethylpyrimidine/phosphomethylpyrimidine kinase
VSASLEGPCVLVIAGSDSSGGAGVDADREALAAQGICALVCVTAWSQQDDGGLRSLCAVDGESWTREALALAAGTRELGAVKFGLLPSAEALCRAADLIGELRARCGDDLAVVLDPVVRASSGARFLDDEALAVLRETLLPLGLIWTPNIPEAALLVGRPAEDLTSDLEARLASARELVAAGAAAVVLKGGHGTEDPVCDLVLAADGEPQWLRHPRLEGAEIRGSGCRFASSLAGALASGVALEEAARSAGELVLKALQRAGRASPRT